MSSYPLIVAQYAIEGHPRRTEHWALVALINKSTARIYELYGNSDTFGYIPRDETSFDRVLNFRGGCHVGTIPAGIEELLRLEERLREVPVVRGSLDSDSQTWIVQSFRLLREDGILLKGVNEAFVREELGCDKERWETGEDTVNERLFPA